MSSNEIAERLAAACWVRVGGVDGGEGVNDFLPSTLRYRSLVGFQQRIITTTAPATRPLFILPLDREFTRRKTAVLGTRIGGVLPNDAPGTSRVSYPGFSTPPDSVAQIIWEPIHLDWLGPDLANPTWMPYGMTGGDSPSVPDGFDLDVYNAVAVLLPAEGGTPLSGDFCVLVLQHPIVEAADDAVEDVLPAQDPPPPVFDPLSTNPLVWWRMDTYTTIEGEEGEDINVFTDRSGNSSGNLTQLGASGLPSPNPTFNNQEAWTPSSIPMNVVDGGGTSDSFWDFLFSGECEYYIVFSMYDPVTQSVMLQDGSQLEVSIDPAGTEELRMELGTGAGILDTALSGFTPTSTEGLAFHFVGELPTNWLMSDTLGSNGGVWDGPVGEASTGVVSFPAAGCFYADIIMWDRTLLPLERTNMNAYILARYGVAVVG